MKFVEIHMKLLILWSAIFLRFFGQHFEQDHHSLQISDHFALHREHLFTHLWTFYTIALQFLHSLYFGHKSCMTHDISAEFMFLAWRKQIRVQILQLAGLSITGHLITHSVELNTNTRWPVTRWFTKQWVMWLPRMHGLAPTPTSVA
jgi:hypothetical protein